uniref:Chorismate mutase domain-containing protein n=1 Tax=Meloidogyne incognita TaxID=6306 RepID=A0A914NJW0_MELIC
MYSKFLNLILFISISIWFVLADQDDNKEKDAVFENVIILVDNVLDFSRPVALFEYANKHPIDHPDKEAAFLERINATAVEIGLDTEFARLFFADQINASKVVQV